MNPLTLTIFQKIDFIRSNWNNVIENYNYNDDGGNDSDSDSNSNSDLKNEIANMVVIMAIGAIIEILLIIATIYYLFKYWNILSDSVKILCIILLFIPLGPIFILAILSSYSSQSQSQSQSLTQ